MLRVRTPLGGPASAELWLAAVTTRSAEDGIPTPCVGTGDGEPSWDAARMPLLPRMASTWRPVRWKLEDKPLCRKGIDKVAFGFLQLLFFAFSVPSPARTLVEWTKAKDRGLITSAPRTHPGCARTRLAPAGPDLSDHRLLPINRIVKEHQWPDRNERTTYL